MKGKFGSASQAFEELIAEPGSAYLMADRGIAGEVQHESDIASWLKALKNDKRYIFKAASAASKAHYYSMGKCFGEIFNNYTRKKPAQVSLSGLLKFGSSDWDRLCQ